jgi:hypothetical protein
MCPNIKKQEDSFGLDQNNYFLIFSFINLHFLMKLFKYWLIGLGLIFCLAAPAWAQDQKDPLINPKNGIQFRLNEEGSHFVKLTFVNQTWVRWNQSNPGSTVFGTPKDQTFDISLRRTRLQLFGQLTDRVFFYLQFGQNNFNYLSPRKTGAFFHDVVGEYAVVKKKLSLGAGLTGWTGPSRFASPSVSSIMAMDAPLFEQANNDVNDQFLRRLSVYAKGKLGKLDYRLALSSPFVTQTASASFFALNQLPDRVATYSANPPELQTSGYLQWQFLDQEANLVPYTTGTYLGKKRVFNLGAGFLAQPNAMWYRQGADTVSANMRLLAIDAFLDMPTHAGRTDAITAYLAYFNNDFGPNFVRNLGVNNPANGVAPGRGSFNGAGNAFPIEGTGNIWFGEVGYKLKDGLLGRAGTLQPYASLQYANYQRLADPMAMWDVGLNWLMAGHLSKLSLDYQFRPIYAQNSPTDIAHTDHRGMVVLQYQVGIF